MSAPMSTDRVTIPALQAMKAAGEKSVCLVAWDYQMARIADRVGVEIVSVGDTVGVNLWGQPHPLEITMAEMLVVAKAVRRGVTRARTVSGGAGSFSSTPAARASSRSRSCCACSVVRKLSGASVLPAPTTSILSSARPRTRASSGRTTSTAWIRSSGR